jgi:hypothetical protein
MKIPRPFRLELLLLLAQAAAFAQSPEMQQILARLDRLEQENQTLKEEVRALRDELHAGAAPVEERLDVHERRIEEQAQTKVEASQRFPIRITGMALANTFLNSKQNGGSDNPTLASVGRGTSTGGATLRQTVLGLEYHGPQTFAGGSVSGSLFLDFFGGSNAPLNNVARIRTGEIRLNWATTTLSFAQDKPLIAPRDPTSIAQVGLSPLTGAGNLWLWEPQVRLEQRFQFNEQTHLRAQVGLIQTTEGAATTPSQFASTLERVRPGLEGRFEVSRTFGHNGRIEIAPGFHASTTHVAAASVPSRAFSMDWLLSPAGWMEFSGAYFTGENLAHLGTGGIRQGFTVLGPGDVIPVRATGGWAQLKLQPTERLSFNLMTGRHDDRNTDLRFGGIAYNHAIGANVFYRLSPNVIVSFETLQVRTLYQGTGLRLNNHYDLAIAYLW